MKSMNSIMELLSNQKLSEISLFINDRCNLKCKHCYVAPGKAEADVSLQRWKDVISEAVGLGVNVLGIVGKEPLLTPEKTFELIKFAKKINRDMVVGFVTNGLLLPKYSKQISEVDPTYIDISIDGTESNHDEIRGKGNFRKTVEGIKSLLDAGFPKEKIFLSITLTSKTDAAGIIKYFNNFGIANFVISPYMLFSHTSEDLSINYTERFKQLIDSELPSIGNDLDSTANIYIRAAEYPFSHLVDFFVSKKYISLDDLLEDKCKNVIFNLHKIGKMNVITNFLPFSTSFIREIRITSDGYVLNCLDQGFEDYKERSIGNIKERDLMDLLGSEKCQVRKKELIEDSVKSITRSKPI